MCGMYATTAHTRRAARAAPSGRGQYIDLSLLDTQVAWLANQNLNYLVSGRAPARHGTAHPNIVPYQAFATADGHLMLAVGNDAQFGRFCEVAGLQELAADPRYATNRAADCASRKLVARLTAVFADATRELARRSCATRRCPAGRSTISPRCSPNRRSCIAGCASTSSNRGAAIPGVRQPIVFSRTALDYERAPPSLGADTDEVLRERLGLDEPTLARAARRRVIA